MKLGPDLYFQHALVGGKILHNLYLAQYNIGFSSIQQFSADKKSTCR